MGLAIESGPFRRAEDAVEEALSLRAEFLAALDEAEASRARGEGCGHKPRILGGSC
jgi:hypothetical protein